MSKQNVDLVRRLLAAFNERDMTTIRSGLHPDVELQTIVEAQHGHAGAADWIARADSVFDSFEMEVEEIIDAGDSVLVVERQRGRGKGSGVLLDQQMYSLFALQDGQILRAKWFMDRDQAFTVAGIAADERPGL